MEDIKLCEELRQVRESLIRVEASIAALKDTQDLELRILRKDIEQEKFARSALDARVKDLEEDRRYKVRVAWAEIIKYGIILLGLIVTFTKI